MIMIIKLTNKYQVEYMRLQNYNEWMLADRLQNTKDSGAIEKKKNKFIYLCHRQTKNEVNINNKKESS